MRAMRLMTGLLAVCGLAVSGAAAIGDRPAVGQPAPPLKLAEVVQSPDGQPGDDITVQELRRRLAGKVVVIEFWGTWCGPCISAMKSLETVERAAAAAEDGGDFVFVYVTDEGPDFVREWLAADHRRRPGGWVVCDLVPPEPKNKHWPGGATFEAWGVEGRPSTWVLRPEAENHIVAGGVHPYLLTVDDLRRVRDGLPALPPNERDGGGGVFVPGENRPAIKGPDLEVELGVDPLAHYEPPEGKESVPAADILVTLRKSAYDRAMTRGYATWISTRIGMTAEVLVEDHFRQKGLPMEWAPGAKDSLPEGLYDYIVRVPRTRWRQYEPLVDAALAAAFGVRARVEEREVNVYLLEAGPQTTSRLQGSIIGPEDGGGTSDYRLTNGIRRLAFVNGDLSWLADMLSDDGNSVVDRPVVDATGLPDREKRGIDLAIEFRERDFEDLKRVLVRELDLRLVPAKRPMKFLVIERIAPDLPEEQPE